ncbi:protein MULTIPOLAR SPINDLE 1 isoform X2 [Amborella trichopoda]|uniref:protein MULTIPOLAR SPINDLE 1 isoform X2 n=1 Tax=Amborella trichopoda TaxID=13333 RepID=UPI0009BD521D|nr:protein MULTIPOLAR SPINDLE 1 isoform X2 [Amborella trichopoda]|eukprot:XP_020518399.1 protein MULTIPOLAR SPINDLE 1 isoform X2 [Amborella trichopoda]
MQQGNNSEAEVGPSVKLALAIALLRSRNSDSSKDVLHWKRKAKERKKELMKLEEELKDVQDGIQREIFSQGPSCKCHFFEDCGNLNSKLSSQGEDGTAFRVNQVLCRRFLRQVRLKERTKKPNGATVSLRVAKEFEGYGEKEQLATSVDFLMELVSTKLLVDNMPSFATFSHQAVDFIIASIKNLLSRGENNEFVEGVINGLIVCLTRRMCISTHPDGLSNPNSESQFFIQHLIRKLGSQPYIGLRTLLSVSQKIATTADGLLFMDPFSDVVPNVHDSMFLMIQLTEFLVTDNIYMWATDGVLENGLFEEWVKWIGQAKKALEILENRNGLYVLYMDRVIGELSKQEAK